MADVVVVGAGIVGASVAYHTARLGAAVALVDKALPGSGVTGDSFGWVGASNVSGPAAPLRAAALRDYRRLEAELPGVDVRWRGSLSWWDAPRPPAGDGEDVALVDAAQVAALEPNLREPPAWAVHRPEDAAVDPVAVTEALVRGARDHGAEVLLGVAVTSVRARDGRVIGVATSGGPLAAAAVVLAAGVDVPVLGAPLGIDVPVAPSPALLLRVDAPEGLVRTLVSSPSVEVREGADGRLLAAVDLHGEDTARDIARTAQRTLAAITSTFRGAEDIRLVSARVGTRPMPSDGEPIIGPVPGVEGAYLAVTHAGVCLAPALGRLVAGELVTGAPAEDLRGCRPQRAASSPAQG